MSCIYGNYRGEEYRTIRHHWEPWYSRNLNEACYSDQDLVTERRSFMMRVLERAQINQKLQCAVDFGGDEGQFFPSIPTDRRIVCDVSNRDLPAEIEHISGLSELSDVKPDLVIVAHVLEHFSILTPCSH